MSFKCLNCGNEDNRYFGIRNGITYCRKCLAFAKKEGDIKEKKSHKEVILDLKYPLTVDQEKISNSIKENIKINKDVLVHAVCGAGKTEIVSKIIYEYLKEGKRVGFFIPRRDLVIEIGDRLRKLFPNTNISLIYGGHINDLSGSLVVSTTHQAYRFVKNFDLVIIDEIDAFPYKDNNLLQNFVYKSANGPIISLSATPSNNDLIDKEVLYLFKRFHGFPMPIPKVIKTDYYHQRKIIFKLLRKYKKEDKPCFIYVPTIEVGTKLFILIKRKFKNATFVYSTMPNREQTLNLIRQGHFTIVVTTTILERGVTFENLQVIVYSAEHEIFDVSTLLQICGRVGRKAKYNNGDIYFLATKQKNTFKKCIQQVERYNENL